MSVRRQTFSDFEIIVVDDASSDDTAAGRPRLRRPRSATSSCWQRRCGQHQERGIAAATGDFIALLDDDDEWVAEKLQRQVELFDRGGPR
jgi:glycosyltransferase involved in cell wall biosynthesis